MIKQSAGVLNSAVFRVLLDVERNGTAFRIYRGNVIFSPPGSVRPEHRDFLRHHRDDVRQLVGDLADPEVLTRRSVFQHQLALTPAPRVPAFLVRPNVPYGRAICFSCGDSLKERRFGRCRPCSIALRLVCSGRALTDLAAAIDKWD